MLCGIKKDQNSKTLFCVESVFCGAKCAKIVLMLNFSNQIQIYTLYFQKSGDGDNDSIKTINISSRVKKIQAFTRLFKLENVLKGSLDLILSPSPSVKIQIIGVKV